jgi:hypothetical protein
MPTLRINTTLPQVIFEPLLGGGYIQPEKSKFTCISVSCEFDVDFGTLAFHTLVKIAKSETADEKVAEKLALEWLQIALPRMLAERGYWNFFQTTEVSRERPAEPQGSANHGLITVHVAPSERILHQASEALTHLVSVENRFELAKERLRELATNNYPLDFAQSLSEAREHIQFIERVLAAGADLGGYEPHKARSALRDYEELGRRKDINNSNYQHALKSLKRFAYGVSFPKTWCRRPDA